MPKKISDEKLIETMLLYGGVSGAAQTLGITRNAVYKRLQDDSFRQQYDKMQGLVLSTAASTMAAGLCEAVDALLSVIRDEKAATTVRVSASDALLRHCNRYIESANILRRLDALESAQRDI